MLRTINSKYFQHFDLLRGFLSLGLGFITGKVSGSDSILTFGSWSRNVKQGSRSLAKSRIDHSIPLLYLETRPPLSFSRDYDYSIVNNITECFCMSAI